jgi:hypothetical protein
VSFIQSKFVTNAAGERVEYQYLIENRKVCGVVKHTTLRCLGRVGGVLSKRGRRPLSKRVTTGSSVPRSVSSPKKPVREGAYPSLKYSWLDLLKPEDDD